MLPIGLLNYFVDVFGLMRLNACGERHTMQISIGLPRNDGVNAGEAIAAVFGCAGYLREL